MKTYQYTEPGFDGSTDATDHLVHWVAASSKESADAYAFRQRWNPGGGEIFGESHTADLLASDGRGGIDVVLQ